MLLCVAIQRLEFAVFIPGVRIGIRFRKAFYPAAEHDANISMALHYLPEHVDAMV
jgi:hypothetical protein